MVDKEYTLLTKSFDLFPFRGKYKVYVVDKNLARRVNEVLKSYDDWTFREGDEAVFIFEPAMLETVKVALRIRG